MDVHCTTCGEPWDVHHLRHDAIHETDLTDEEKEAWSRLPTKRRLAPQYRQAFRSAGYAFGASVLDVVKCPCCPKDAKTDPSKAELKSALAELLGDDEDGIAATMEDFGL